VKREFAAVLCGGISPECLATYLAHTGSLSILHPLELNKNRVKAKGFAILYTLLWNFSSVVFLVLEKSLNYDSNVCATHQIYRKFVYVELSDTFHVEC
jgi:hypothetical protein